MNYERILQWVSPLMLGAVGGLLIVLNSVPSLMHGNSADYESAGWVVWLGTPFVIGCLLGHLLIRSLTKKRALYIWIIELFLTVPFLLFFVTSPR